MKILRGYPDLYYTYAQMGGYGSSGVPDILVCANGRFIAIECKAGKNTVTGLQQHNIDKIKAAQGVAVVINESNLHELEEILHEVYKSNR